MTDRPQVDAVANDAALRHLARRLHNTELQLAISVGNLALATAHAGRLQARLDELEPKKTKTKRVRPLTSGR